MTTTYKCDYVVNNMTKMFNVYIVHARLTHLIEMLEDIGVALMERMVIKKGTMETSEDKTCPRIRSKLEKEKEE